MSEVIVEGVNKDGWFTARRIKVPMKQNSFKKNKKLTENASEICKFLLSICFSPTEASGGWLGECQCRCSCRLQ